MRSRKDSCKINPIGHAIITVIMYFMAGIFLIPFFMMILTTFKDEEHIYDPFYFPNFTYLDNFKKVFEIPSFYTSFLNTVIICVITLTLAILVSSMAGYRVSRSKERFYKVTYAVFIMTMIIPTQTNMVLLYKLGSAIHLINTLPFLILIYLSGNVAYSSLIYAAFTKSIHRELEEAAKIDGCGKFKTFARIIFPLLMPATGTIIAIETFWYWNDFQGPLIYLSDVKMRTLMLEIYNFKTILGTSTYTSTQWGPVTALCLIATIPILLFFLITQKYLLRGLNIGAVKG